MGSFSDLIYLIHNLNSSLYQNLVEIFRQAISRSSNFFSILSRTNVYPANYEIDFVAKDSNINKNKIAI